MGEVAALIPWVGVSGTQRCFAAWAKAVAGTAAFSFFRLNVVASLSVYSKGYQQVTHRGNGRSMAEVVIASGCKAHRVLTPHPVQSGPQGRC